MQYPYPLVNVAPAQRYRMRYGVLECEACGLAKEYCRGHAAEPGSAAQDGAAESDLVRRVREARAVGGR